MSDHAGRLAGWTGDFADEINDQLALAATDAQVYRAAARVEARIECLLDDWDEVRSVKPHPPDERGWKLLVGTYRDLAEQVQGWLDEMLEILEDPAAAVERRGLADEETATITVSLTILPPPQAKPLSRWVRERARVSRRATGGLSLFAALLAGIGLGWLFGGDDD
ncbi:MAG: hypothetical protein F4X99_11825 [Gammaproteobacteria bacterium]|nr:hypothetical protein [Gammaproteobacteria bacterium]